MDDYNYIASLINKNPTLLHFKKYLAILNIQGTIASSMPVYIIATCWADTVVDSSVILLLLYSATMQWHCTYTP